MTPIELAALKHRMGVGAEYLGAVVTVMGKAANAVSSEMDTAKNTLNLTFDTVLMDSSGVIEQVEMVIGGQTFNLDIEPAKRVMTGDTFILTVPCTLADAS